MRFKFVAMVVVLSMILPVVSFAQGTTSAPMREPGASSVSAADRLAEKVTESKTRFLQYIDKIIGRLESYKSTVLSLDGLTVDQKSLITQNTDEVTAQFLAAQVSVERATTMVELASVRSTLAGVWSKTVHVRNMVVGFSVTNRFSVHIARMEEISTKISDKLEEYSAKDSNVSDVEDALIGYRSELASAQVSIESAQRAFGTMTNESEFQSGMSSVRGAKSSLYQSGVQLRLAVAALAGLSNQHEQ